MIYLDRDAARRLKAAAAMIPSGRVPKSMMEAEARALWVASEGNYAYEREGGAMDKWNTTLLLTFTSLGGERAVGAHAMARGIGTDAERSR